MDNAIPFSKYQGTGNDFVLIDNRTKKYLTRKDVERIRRICDRKFGVGADGLILLQNLEGYDFEMVYFNADGNESTMCGNGGRCIAAFAKKIGIIEDHAHFLAIDGPHEASIAADGTVSLKMTDVKEVVKATDHYELNTGSPHYVTFVEDVDDINVLENGQAIRYSKKYRDEGINVNFVEIKDQEIIVLTYERGVEGETLSCGTGVTAAAMAYYLEAPSPERQSVNIQTKGGHLNVSFQNQAADQFAEVWLSGPADLVFTGTLC